MGYNIGPCLAQIRCGGPEIACVTAQTEAPGGRTEAREASTLFASNDHEVLVVKNVFELNLQIEVNLIKNSIEISALNYSQF